MEFHALRRNTDKLFLRLMAAYPKAGRRRRNPRQDFFEKTNFTLRNSLHEINSNAAPIPREVRVAHQVIWFLAICHSTFLHVEVKTLLNPCFLDSVIKSPNPLNLAFRFKGDRVNKLVAFASCWR